jgi:hypothetical protein
MKKIGFADFCATYLEWDSEWVQKIAREVDKSLDQNKKPIVIMHRQSGKSWIESLRREYQKELEAVGFKLVKYEE